MVEFIVYNTPGPHGYTPRDIDRRWSLASPLERELQPFQVNEFEPLSEYASKLFRTYRDIRTKVVGWLHNSSVKRADLANRFRKEKKIVPGMEVVLRDPRQRKAGGRTPYKQPYTEPCVVTEVHGNKATIRRSDGTKAENIHFEDMMIIPENAKSLEKEPWVFLDDEDELTLDDIDIRRSPGTMLEDGGGKVAEHAKKMKPGRLEGLNTGNYIAYVLAGQTKKCAIGKILAVSRAEATVVIQRHRPITDNRLRLYWSPVFVEDGIEVFGSGTKASTETVEVKRILWPIQLHDGVLGHAAARRLDHGNWTFSDKEYQDTGMELPIPPILRTRWAQ